MTDPGLLGTTWSCVRDGAGRFRCPGCGEERGFTRNRLQRHLMVLGRRVARLGGPEEYATCAECGHAYPYAVVAVADAAAARDARAAVIEESGGDASASPVVAEDEAALLEILAAVIFSDSAVRSSEKVACREVVRRYSGRAVSAAAMDDLLQSARGRRGDPVARLVRLRCLIPEPMKRRIVESAYHVCTADGELHREESRLLNRIGTALDLAPRQVRRALADAKRHPVTGL